MKAIWVLLVACLFPHAVGCDDGDACGDYESDYEALVAGAKACSSDADCQILQVNCQMVDRCTEYVNLSVGVEDLDSLTHAWKDQGCGGPGGHSCCDGADPPPAAVCVAGQCEPAPDPLEACNDGEAPACEDVFACENDSDCVKVGGECCPCTMGGSSTAINICCIDEHEALLGCGPTRSLCNQSLACNDLVPACEDGQCVLAEPGEVE